MDEFDKAVIRAEKRQQKAIRYQPVEHPMNAEAILDAAYVEPVKEPPKVKVKQEKLQTNEIWMVLFVDGEQYDMTLRVNFNDIIGSQRNKAGLTRMIKEALIAKFGKVDDIS